MSNQQTAGTGNRNIFIIIIAAGLILGIGFGYKMYSRHRLEQMQNEVAQFYATPKPTPAAIVSVAPPAYNYQKPVIDMGYSDFVKLCGQPDDIRTIQERGGETIIYEYAFTTDERGKIECYGTFTFTDYKLRRIVR